MGGRRWGRQATPCTAVLAAGQSGTRRPRALASLLQELCGSYLQGGGLSCIF